MHLRDALRTTGAVREFDDRPIADEVLAEVLDDARFAPSGGNRQSWRVVVVRDPDVRRQIGDLYRAGWYEYVAATNAGLVPWAPITDRAAEAAAFERGRDRAAAHEPLSGLAADIDHAPAVLVVLADLRYLAAIDRDLDRYSLVGGASIYPFAWSVLLAARERGIAGVMTTVLVRHEPEVLALLDAPPELIVAATIVLGYPVAPPPTRLKRGEVSTFATFDSLAGPPLDA